MKKLSAYILTILLACAVIGCGGGTGGKQYILGVEGSYTLTPPVTTSLSKLETPTPQVMIGATFVEVNTDTAESLGVEFKNFSVQPQTPPADDLNFTIELTPSATSLGTIFKLDDAGIPYGVSIIDLDLSVSSTSDIEFIASPDTAILDEGRLLHLGSIRFEADANDRSRIPSLGNLPVINFLFRGEHRHAAVEELIIMLTPQILNDTE